MAEKWQIFQRGLRLGSPVPAAKAIPTGYQVTPAISALVPRLRWGWFLVVGAVEAQARRWVT